MRRHHDKPKIVANLLDYRTSLIFFRRAFGWHSTAFDCPFCYPCSCRNC